METLRIFVSYSNLDAGDFAKFIAQSFERVGCKVFLASGITGGENWREIIQDNISDCDIFVVLITRRALYSQYVEAEVNAARQLQKRIIPCRHEGIGWEEFSWLGLSEYQGVREFSDKHSLIRELDSLLFETPEEVEEQPDEGEVGYGEQADEEQADEEQADEEQADEEQADE